MDIAAWLSNLGLGKYASNFVENEITPEALAYLSDADLKELGLPIGPRKLILAAIAQLGKADLRGGPAPSLKSEPAPTHGPAPRPEAARRQLTIMFVDLVGSTALSSRLDPEEMGEVIRSYQKTVANRIARLDGHVAKFMGDGVLAYFGWPRAHEDDAERAVRAGLDIVLAVAELVTATNEPLAARVGIATGVVLVGDLIGEGPAQEEAVVGETPNLAARLQSLATPGGVVVAGQTRRLLGERFETIDLGTHELKGFAQAMEAWSIIGESRAESRFEAQHGMRVMPLVGRHEELDLLLDLWRRARDGHGQVVLLSGEPGIGKSRLAIALGERLSGEETRLLRYHGSPYHTNSVLFPVLDQLKRAADLGKEDPPEIKLAKLKRLLVGAESRPDSWVPLIAEQLGIPIGDRLTELAPEDKKAKIFRFLLADLECHARKQPILMTAEDVHWFDPTSLELLDHVVDQIERMPLLLVVTFRPEFALRWTGRPHVTRINLGRLRESEGAVLINQVAGARSVPADVQAQILAKTEGVPLFLEELTKTVLETGFHGSVPSTLHDSLLARLDRVARVKEIAQIGAVIGREFSYELIAAAAELDEGKLRSALDELVRAELAYCRGSPPHTVYTFKHALVRDVAYQSLLKRRRQELHCRLATVLHERFTDRSEVEPEVLAHHATQAGLVDLAVSSWHKAGLRANYRSAGAEAIAHFSKALNLLAQLPETPARHNREIDLLIALGNPLGIAAGGRGSAEAMSTYTRATELCATVGAETARLFPALRGLWTSYRARGEMRTARDLAERLLTIARSSEDQSLLLEAHHAQWTTHFCLGTWKSVLEHTIEGLALYQPEHFSNAFIYGGHDSAVCGTIKQGFSLCMLGSPERALIRANESVALASKLSHPPSIAHALYHATALHTLRRDLSAARGTAQEMFQLAHDRMPSWIKLAEIILRLISALEDENQARESIAIIQNALTTKAIADIEARAFILSLFGDTCRLAGEVDAGLSVLEPAMAEASASGARLWEAELNRIVGNLVLRSTLFERERSEFNFVCAIEIAREQHALSLELRASMSLARLWAERGERRKAYDLLAPIYARFGEGFDTPDLIDAKMLLDDLD